MIEYGLGVQLLLKSHMILNLKRLICVAEGRQDLKEVLDGTCVQELFVPLVVAFLMSDEKRRP